MVQGRQKTDAAINKVSARIPKGGRAMRIRVKFEIPAIEPKANEAEENDG